MKILTVTRWAALLTAATVAVGGGLWLRSVPPKPVASTLPALTMALRALPWEGGPAAYKGSAAAVRAGWTRPGFFPVGLWFASARTAREVALDRAAGINTYIEPTGGSRPDLLRKSGMTALTSRPLPGAGAETVGWLIADKADVWAGPGNGRWTGARGFTTKPVCVPVLVTCGYTVMGTLAGRLPKDDRLRYASFGKGVAYWEEEALAAKFVNGYSDVVAADVSWYGDPNVCAEATRWLQLPAAQCRLAANYGATVERLRTLDAADGRRQPVYAIISLAGLTPEQVGGAAMSALIHGARGIVYDAHGTDPACKVDNVLRHACGKAVRGGVAELDRRIARLAPVLNTQSYAYDFAPELDTMLKRLDGDYYLFTMLGRGQAPGPRVLTVPSDLSAAGHIQEIFEDRTIPVDREGHFTETFDAEHSYHVYRIAS
ncbi:hypothetical protein ACQP2T_58220 [Nonomuraea sp. CA-143628]|uniref:hypothetical protein n=1 Tax=Nonomuraea sp. CA-143628 TaxID=3239997 RepID=UPI003D9260C3